MAGGSRALLPPVDRHSISISTKFVIKFLLRPYSHYSCTFIPITVGKKYVSKMLMISTDVVNSAKKSTAIKNEKVASINFV